MRNAVVALIAVASILLVAARPSGPPPQLVTGDAPSLAHTLVSIARDGKVISRQRSTIWLEREKPPFAR